MGQKMNEEDKSVLRIIAVIIILIIASTSAWFYLGNKSICNRTYNILKEESQYKYPKVQVLENNTWKLIKNTSMKYPSYDKTIAEMRDDKIEFNDTMLDSITMGMKLTQLDSYQIIGQGLGPIESRSEALNKFRAMLPEEIGDILLIMDDFDLLDTSIIKVIAILPTGEMLFMRVGDDVQVTNHIIFSKLNFNNQNYNQELDTDSEFVMD